MPRQKFDVAVIGGGPGGSTIAALLAKKNHSVVLIEKESYPHFKIGESLLPHSMDILKKSGVYDRIDNGKYIRKYGASFIDHRESKPLYFEFANGLDSDHAFAFEVPRDQFDKDLLEHAQELGVHVLQPSTVQSVTFKDDRVEMDTDTVQLSATFVVDASGRAAVLGKKFQSRQKNQHFFNNVAVYNHYRNVKRDVQEQEGDIVIGILPEQCWSWHIPFKGEVTSVGVVFSPESFKKHKNNPNLIEEKLQCHPKFKDMMAEAEPLGPLKTAANYSYASEKKLGERWIMVGDAATFLDPVFSSGVHLSLRSAELSAEVIDEALKANTTLTRTQSGKNYDTTLQKGVDRFQSLLLLFYQSPFYKHMSKTIEKDFLYKSFTSAIGGDMWNEDNCLFRLGVLKDGKLPQDNYSL